MIAREGQQDKIILLVEDSKADIRLVQEVLKTSTVPHQLMIVRNGMDAMAYLRKDGEFNESPRPNLIILDLNLPRKDGRKVLAEIKSDTDLKRIPVIV